jgi:hypothetical protein
MVISKEAGREYNLCEKTNSMSNVPQCWHDIQAEITGNQPMWRKEGGENLFL